MANLRISNIKASDIRTIKASFTHTLDSIISIGNVLVTSLTAGVPDATVLGVVVSDNKLTITTQPMTPMAQYEVVFQSTDDVSFKSLDGSAFLFEDNKTNKKLILGPEEPINEVRDNLILYLKDNVYNLERGTFVRDIIEQISGDITRLRANIRQAKNDNYLSLLITDERKRRGKGPFDRLNEEGAYKLLRVGKTTTGANLSSSISFESFPSGIVTLQATSIINEELIVGANGLPGTFDKLVFTVLKYPVTKVNSVTIQYQDGYVYKYSINTYGYLLNNPIYDTDFASTLLTLENNQVKLSESILNDTNFSIPAAGDTVLISYEYKSLGKTIDENSVTVSKTVDIVREPTPALINVFTLENAPIVDEFDQIPSIDGIQFLDPNSSTPFLTNHPAFTKELPFKYDGLPSSIGEYTVDYENGRVFVFGEDDGGKGTGNFPPAATYKYRKYFRENLDYTYNGELHDLVASPIRDLPTQQAKISFNYEFNLVPDVDFVANLHKESIDERIENRLLSLNSLRTKNFPVTNVFRIFNETTGEIYPVTRFNDNTIYFSSNNPPRIFEKASERASFTNVLNETLIVSDELTNSSSIRIFKIQLLNNRIMGITDDVIGSSFNSSAQFSRTGVFVKELYFDGQILDVTTNIERLDVGFYQIDYENGTLYVGVDTDQTFDVGTISYKKSVVQPKNTHVIAVSDIFYSINLNIGVSKRLNYTSFDEGEITPSSFDISDERFLNNDITLPYNFVASTITVMDDIKSVRHIFDVFDLNNNEDPIDFAPSVASTSANIITLDTIGIERRETLTVGAGLTLVVSTISSGIEIGTAKSAVRISDDAELLDGYQTISGNTITLAASSGAIIGDIVDVIYTVVLNGASTPVVDYNRGDYYIKYTYLADEILVSYEYGDNVIDFRESTTLNEGDEYFVTYRAGALRDSLLPNFGSLIDIASIRSFDINLSRDIYRDALIGALQSFINGPTIPSLKKIASQITKIEPEIIESIFEVWSLGFSRLFLSPPFVVGEPQLMPGKFDNGILIDEDGQSVTFPVSSNLRLEEGTLEVVVIPEWNGLDNDATLIFSNLKKDGYNVSSSNIFIGSSSYNPEIIDGEFSINKNDNLDPSGLPSAIFTENGFFIYFDTDENRWKILVKDRPSDGYTYSGTITSSGEVYDVKFIEGLGEVDDFLRSKINDIDFIFNLGSQDLSSPDGYSTTDGYITGYSFDGITFQADDFHYIFDFAEERDKNRFSLFKDGRGYLNFQIWDRGGKLPNKKTQRNRYEVSTDISNWLAGEKHHVAIAWKLNTSDRRDEMHLFVDGFEVPNILLYGGRPIATSSDKFGEVKPELVAGTITLKSIVGNDLTTTTGSSTVVSDSIDFSSEGIVPGNTIQINETGFSTYTILTVTGSALVLDASMPASLSDARFSVNPFSTTVSSEIDLFSNIAVSILRSGEETELPGIRAEIPGYGISKNSFNQNVLTIFGNAEVGDQILIRTLGKNHRRCRSKVYLWGNSTAVLKTALPPPINLDEVSIRAVLMPLIPIGPDNASLVGPEFQATNLAITQPTNSTEGRTLEVRITGGNVNFSTPTTVTINGTTSTGPTFETLNFSTYGTQQTTLKFLTTTGVDVNTTPIITTKDGIAVEIKEAYSVTYPNGNNNYPVIRFAYKTQSGLTLEGDGNVIVSDDNGFFPESNVDNLLVIESPLSVAGTYIIEDRLDNTTVRLDTATGSLFTDGKYSIYNISIGRSGFQNGFFFFELAGSANTAYPLPQGYYEFDYSAYLEIPFDPINQTAHIGSNFNNEKPAKAIIDEFRISSMMLTDTRVGEELAINEESVTSGFLSLNPFKKNSNTLMLLHFDEFPLVNDSDYYMSATREYLQSGTSVSENFGQSIVITDKGLSFDNNGRLDTRSEGSIEFWVSPRYDTYNDPSPRFYFDATSTVVEEIASLTRGTLKVSRRVSEIVSVRLQTDIQDTGIEYFGNGSIGSDRQTITLQKPLPFQQTPVKVAYIPIGLQGDRVSIYKDSEGFIVFNVRANGSDYQVRQPVFWKRDSWHRVRTTYKFNRTDNRDEIRLFIDGEEKGVILFGTGLFFGENVVFGQTTVGVTNQILVTDINFTDTIAQFSIGSDYLGKRTAQARIDNFKISNISKNPVTINGQPFDVSFNQNLTLAFPSIEDAFTTFLMDFDQMITKTDDFTILRDEHFGIFNFTMNILDSFGIVSGNTRIERILKDLILALKPASSKAEINIIE